PDPPELPGPPPPVWSGPFEESSTTAVVEEPVVEGGGTITASSAPPDSRARSSRDSTVNRQRQRREAALGPASIFCNGCDHREEIMLQLFPAIPCRKAAPGMRGIRTRLHFT